MDIKADNVLIKGRTARITDYTLSVKVEESNGYIHTFDNENPIYFKKIAPPELITGKGISY